MSIFGKIEAIAFKIYQLDEETKLQINQLKSAFLGIELYYFYYDNKPIFVNFSTNNSEFLLDLFAKNSSSLLIHYGDEFYIDGKYLYRDEFSSSDIIKQIQKIVKKNIIDKGSDYYVPNGDVIIESDVIVFSSNSKLNGQVFWSGFANLRDLSNNIQKIIVGNKFTHPKFYDYFYHIDLYLMYLGKINDNHLLVLGEINNESFELTTSIGNHEESIQFLKICKFELDNFAQQLISQGYLVIRAPILCKGNTIFTLLNGLVEIYQHNNDYIKKIYIPMFKTDDEGIDNIFCNYRNEFNRQVGRFGFSTIETVTISEQHIGVYGGLHCAANILSRSIS